MKREGDEVGEARRSPSLNALRVFEGGEGDWMGLERRRLRGWLH